MQLLFSCFGIRSLFFLLHSLCALHNVLFRFSTKIVDIVSLAAYRCWPLILFLFAKALYTIYECASMRSLFNSVIIWLLVRSFVRSFFRLFVGVVYVQVELHCAHRAHALLIILDSFCSMQFFFFFIFFLFFSFDFLDFFVIILIVSSLLGLHFSCFSAHWSFIILEFLCPVRQSPVIVVAASCCCFFLFILFMGQNVSTQSLPSSFSKKGLIYLWASRFKMNVLVNFVSLLNGQSFFELNTDFNRIKTKRMPTNGYFVDLLNWHIKRLDTWVCSVHYTHIY